MKVLTISTLIIFFCLHSFGQSDMKADANLDSSNGFLNFIYGTSIKNYKSFKLIPTKEVFQQYGSNSSFKYQDIQIDSVQLFFFKDKLYTIELFIKKLEREKMTTALEKLYGTKSPMRSEEDEYVWSDHNQGKRKLSIYSVGNDIYTVHFENTENEKERMDATLDKLMK